MPHYKLVLLGFGNVGQALARLLLKKRAELEDRYTITFSVTGLATGRHGAALDPDGLALEQALALAAAGSPSPNFPVYPHRVMPMNLSSLPGRTSCLKTPL